MKCAETASAFFRKSGCGASGKTSEHGVTSLMS
jgi:hypothetical protein